jgi:hypothetical protein
MNTADLAALIAAVFWALLVCVAVFVLFRLGRLLSESSKLVADVRERGDVLLRRAEAAVDGAQAAVDRAGLGRAISVGPLGRAGALAYGIRHAVGIRRTVPGRVLHRAELHRTGLNRAELNREAP